VLFNYCDGLLIMKVCANRHPFVFPLTLLLREGGIRETNHLILYKMAFSIVWNGSHRAIQMLIDKFLDIMEYQSFI